MINKSYKFKGSGNHDRNSLWVFLSSILGSPMDIAVLVEFCIMEIKTVSVVFHWIVVLLVLLSF